MATHIISYDLRKPGQNYDALYERIKTYDNWAHIAKSTWAVVTAKTAEQVRDNLFAVMDDNDRLVVVKSGGAGAWHNVICSNQWLKDNL